MKLTGLILFVLLKSSLAGTYNPEALDYVLRSIEHEANIESGLFRCVFYDISRPNAFRNFLGDVLQSPRLENVLKDRPLNVFELMLMPFSWQVWLLLISIFVVSEVTAQVFPSLFENDPVLLAVCGFERRSLHETRQRETIILHSLMILMFFMSNAYETKIVSLMIDRPAIQRIKTLEDLENSNVKFSGHLEHNSHYVNNSVVGKMIVNGTHLFIRDKVPGFGLYLLSEQTEVLEFTAFDYNRMQPWYVILDYEFYVGPRTYYMSWRNRFLEVFRYIQITLTEAGLLDLWTRQWQYDVRPLHHGQRMRVEIESSHLENNPDYANDPIIGRLIVNGSHLFMYDKVPGFGLYLLREQAEILEFTAFDYDRMQPFYVILDYEFYVGPKMYYLSWRNRYLEAFRHIQITLTEAGLFDLWMRQWQYEERPFHSGQRLRVETGSKVVLNFADMQLAWVVLAIGLTMSVVALFGEIAKKQIGSLWKRQDKKSK
ncbi:hypothetical protein pipiens_008114 [Culex pipiens pipiens]|uniref:Ionotropic receptor n=1 Tax=Culex pipiens pipiens TaxID=38569 RepID=A0ABD1DJ47_CULPP